MTYGKPTDRWLWALNEEQNLPFIKQALELGVNLFDTADVYSYGASKEVDGKALKEYVRCEEVVIATKVFNPMIQYPGRKGLPVKLNTEEINQLEELYQPHNVSGHS